LTQSAASWQGFRAIEGANIVQTEESTLEHIVTSLILSVNPPEEKKSNLVKLKREQDKPGKIE